MFVLCPHCQFLVAVDPVSGEPPSHCPRCDGAIAPPTVAAIATAPVVVAAAAAIDAEVETQAPPALAPPPAPEPEPEPEREPEPEPEPALEPEPASHARADATSDAGETVAEPATADLADDPDASVASAIEPPPLAAPARKRAPSFVRAPAADDAQARRRWPMPLAIAGLALLLVLQMLLADRARLAGDARWRPALIALCATLRCDLPQWHEPAAFTLVDRDVRPDPRTPGVLHVRARFRNDARWPQSWPPVLLTLSDVDGRVAGARLFSPREYGAPAVTRNPIASGQVADIAMDVVEPAPGIVAFTFDFR